MHEDIGYLDRALTSNRQKSRTPPLTHWGRVTHICVGKLTIIGSDNGLSPERRQVIIWTNAGMLLIGPLGTNFREILIEIQTFSLKKVRLKMSSAKWRLFGLGLNELIGVSRNNITKQKCRISIYREEQGLYHDFHILHVVVLNVCTRNKN